MPLSLSPSLATLSCTPDNMHGRRKRRNGNQRTNKTEKGTQSTLDSSYLAHVCLHAPKRGEETLTGGGFALAPIGVDSRTDKVLYEYPHRTLPVCRHYTHTNTQPGTLLLHASQRTSAPVPPPPLPWYDPIPLAAANTSPLGRCRRCHERVISLYRPPKSKDQVSPGPLSTGPPCLRNPGQPQLPGELGALGLGVTARGTSTSVN
jgi:hypothetical protein